MKSKYKVLLCSPYGNTVGGISRRTIHVINYYTHNNESRVFLKQFYPDTKDMYVNTTFLIRIFMGVTAYFSILFKLRKKSKKEYPWFINENEFLGDSQNFAAIKNARIRAIDSKQKDRLGMGINNFTKNC